MAVMVRKKFQMTIFTMPNKMSILKYSPKPVSGLADVGVPHGGEDGLPELRPEGPDPNIDHAMLISMKN